VLSATLTPREPRYVTARLNKKLRFLQRENLLAANSMAKVGTELPGAGQFVQAGLQQAGGLRAALQPGAQGCDGTLLVVLIRAVHEGGPHVGLGVLREASHPLAVHPQQGGPAIGARLTDDLPAQRFEGCVLGQGILAVERHLLPERLEGRPIVALPGIQAAQQRVGGGAA